MALGLLALPCALKAQQRLPLKLAPKPTVAAITPADLMTRVYRFADDSMMGRETGTVYHDKGTDYIASELTRLGLRPRVGRCWKNVPLSPAGRRPRRVSSLAM